jgi:hypothetical protein
MANTANTNSESDSLVSANFKTKYTKSIDESGWLMVKLSDSTSVFLPEYLKVTIQKENDRTYFIINEGKYSGASASLKKENAEKCLISIKRGSGATLIVKTGDRKNTFSKIKKVYLNQLFSKLTFEGKEASVTLDSDLEFDDPVDKIRKRSKPLPSGTYKILTPEHPHNSNMTSFYVTSPDGDRNLKYHTVWFALEYKPTKNSNFIHVGNLSEGCVTVYQLSMWNPLYLYLISNRLDATGNYIGTIEIK